MAENLQITTWMKLFKIIQRLIIYNAQITTTER